LAGIYIHIPFCKQACLYCNFHFSVSLSKKTAVVNAILKEIELQAKEKFIAGKLIDTIYFGGGTPSLLNVAELNSIIQTLQKKFTIATNAELTLEANPDDITANNLQQWKAAGINRLSVGLQSFREDELRWMNRAHTAAESLHCLDLIQKSEFTNYSIDFIYGSPLQKEEDIEMQFEKIATFKIPHISCYALTVEENTALYQKIRKKELTDVDHAHQEKMFFSVLQQMEKFGYEQYEISNFCQPGKESLHNSSYWQGKPYWGFGPAAHSFNGKNIRRWNVANNSIYLTQIEQNILPFEQEELTMQQIQNEFVMTMLRTKKGIPLVAFEEKFGAEALKFILKEAEQHLKQNKLLSENDYLFVPTAAKFLSDGIAADLFLL
jgi:oxygen-independent coproporphyrinogen III oxidase